jgi:hypothetical protein
MTVSVSFPGNLTLLGSTANIIVAESDRDIGGIGFFDYLKVGFPLAVITALGRLGLARGNLSSLTFEICSRAERVATGPAQVQRPKRKLSGELTASRLPITKSDIIGRTTAFGEERGQH